MYVLHPNLLSQLIVNFGDKKILSDIEQVSEIWVLEVYRKRKEI